MEKKFTDREVEALKKNYNVQVAYKVKKTGVDRNNMFFGFEKNWL